MTHEIGEPPQPMGDEVAAGKIFLCYRREDSAGHAGRVYDRLNRRFPGRVFMDVAGIGVGTRWAEVIEQTLGACDVAVILIGRRWLERDPAGIRRLDDPEDPLRAEITMALRLKLRIIPLLVAGAAVPQQDELPQDVAPIVDWQALRIDDDDFDHDSSRLINSLERQLKDEGPDPHLESADAQSSEIRRLLASAEECIARADWITAAQILKSVLSLDKTHAEAATRLQFIRQQSTRPYTPEPPKRRAGRWTAFGVMGLMSGIGAATVVMILIVLMVSMGKTSTDVKPDIGGLPQPAPPQPTPPQPTPPQPTPPQPTPPQPTPPQPTPPQPTPPQPTPPQPTPPRPTPPPQPTEAPVDQQMAGEYELISYTLQDKLLPVSGSMRLLPISDGRFRFEMSVTHPALGVYNYKGIFEGQGTNWTMTTSESNDPTALKVPIPAQVDFDGSTLVMKSPYVAASTVWKKQPGQPQ